VQALLGSTVNVDRSCFEDGEADYVVFIDPSSMYTSSLNYIDSFESKQCPQGNPDGRLFKEDPNSGCFIGGNTCTGTCMLFATAMQCMAQMSPTFTPAPIQTPPPIPPTVPPTPSPTTITPLSPWPTIEMNVTIAPTGEITPAPSEKPVLPPTPVIPVVPTRQPTFECDDSSSKKSKKSKAGIGKGKGSGYIAKGGKGSSKHPKCKSSKSKGKRKGKGKGRSKGTWSISGAINWHTHHGKGYFVDTGMRTFEDDSSSKSGVGERQRGLRVYQDDSDRNTRKEEVRIR